MLVMLLFAVINSINYTVENWVLKRHLNSAPYGGFEVYHLIVFCQSETYSNQRMLPPTIVSLH